MSDQTSSQSPLTRINRRTFLKYAAAIGVVTYAGNSYLNRFSSSAKGKILIIGGGAAGISMAARLMRWLEEPDITLVDPSERQFYQPGFTMIAAGIFDPDEVSKPQQKCIPKGVKWIKDHIIKLDPISRKAATAKSGSLDYDFLVLAPGLQLNWEGVEGIERDRLGEGNAHCIYDYEGAVKTWPAIQKFSGTGGRGIFTNTYTKLKCGGAPKKIALLTEHHCRKEGTRDKVSLTYFNASEKIFDTPFYASRIQEIFDERQVEVKPSHRLVGIDLQSKRAYFDEVRTVKREVMDEATGKRNVDEETFRKPVAVDYDFMHFVPPMSAPDFVRNAGLGWTSGSLQKEAWVMVDKETLVHATYPNIISLGDVAGTPASKTSAAIRVQAPIAAKNLISLMEGKEPTEKYNGYSACPIITEYGKVLMAEFDYDKNPMPTFSYIDSSKEQHFFWFLKKHMLKPVYFHGMLNGWM
jgi:sulfide:quinone oxidoreductase